MSFSAAVSSSGAVKHDPFLLEGVSLLLLNETQKCSLLGSTFGYVVLRDATTARSAVGEGWRSAAICVGWPAALEDTKLFERDDHRGEVLGVRPRP